MQSSLSVCVTGSSKGIGLAMIKGLIKKPQQYKLFVTSRALDRAQQTVDELLKEEDLQDSLTALELDLSNKASIDDFLERISEEGGLDILVNNGGINLREDAKTSQEKFDLQWNVNYTHTRYLIEQALEKGVFNKNGKIITVTSMNGKFLRLKEKNPEVSARIEKYHELGYEDLAELEQRCQEEYFTEKKDQWHKLPYSASKMFMNLFCIIASKDARFLDQGLQVYTMCPGWCKSEMNACDGDKPPRTVEQGAETALYLIDLPQKVDPELQGKFFEYGKVSEYASELDVH